MARARKSIRPDPYQKPFIKKLSPEQSKPGILPQFLEPTRANFDLHSAYASKMFLRYSTDSLTSSKES